MLSKYKSDLLKSRSSMKSKTGDIMTPTANIECGDCKYWS